MIGLEIEKEGLATAKEIAELRKQMITSHPGIGEEKLMKLVAASLFLCPFLLLLGPCFAS